MLRFYAFARIRWDELLGRLSVEKIKRLGCAAVSPLRHSRKNG